MIRSKMRWSAISALVAALTMVFVASVAGAQTAGSFTVKSITPNPFTPQAGQTTMISYTAPAMCNSRIAVRNSAGTEIRQIVNYINMPAGSYTRTWDGKDRNGRIVVAGAYTIVVEGKTTTGTALGTGTGTVTVGSTTTPPATTGSFKVTSVSPSSFEPSKGQTTTISYTAPALCNSRIAVRNSAGTEIRQIVNYVNMPAGSYTRTWDGKDRNGQVVVAGTYTIVVEGKTTAGAALGTGTGTVIVGSTTTPPPATTGSFKVTGVSPSSFDPSKGQTTTISYTAPALCNSRIAVRNSAGTEIRQIVNYVNMPAGSYTRTWDGKDRNGQVVAAGTYTIVVEGKTTAGATLGTGTDTVVVATGTVTPPPTTDPGTGPAPAGTELGQLVEGCGRANFDWFKNGGTKFDVAFKAVKSGTVTEFSVPWRLDPGYGSGNYGTFTWELQSNGAGNFPSGTVITRVTGLHPKEHMSATDAPFRVAMSANLVAGQVYHLVMINTDSNYSSNWSSINTVMSRIVPWDPANAPDARGAYTNGSTWSPWSSNSDAWNSGGGNNKNGSHIGLVIKWSDGSTTGDPYWSAAMSDPANISGSSRAGQQIVWNRASATITRVGVSVKGSGTLKYHLEQVGKGDIASGTFSGTSIGSVAQWVYATLPQAVTLQQGQTYRLWFEATSGSFSQNPVYGPSSPSDWYNVSWGGPQSCVITGSGGSWSTKPTQDLAFSLK